MEATEVVIVGFAGSDRRRVTVTDRGGGRQREMGLDRLQHAESMSERTWRREQRDADEWSSYSGSLHPGGWWAMSTYAQGIPEWL